ncbi:MAG: hypothetical protein QW390_05160 [Candidatus Bathyarchaeia archaeon]
MIKRKAYKLRLSAREQAVIDHIREISGFPATTSLIIKAAIEHFHKYVQAEKEFEDRYLRALAEEAVLKRAYFPHHIEYYVKEALEKHHQQATKALDKAAEPGGGQSDP